MNINTHIRLLLVPILSVVLFSCGESHFLKEEAYRNQVFQDFEQKQRALPHGDLFTIFSDSILTLSEREALMFLYAYMPIGDITDYSGNYYLENLRLSEQARNEMSWGKNVTDELFRHFVLPIRVNNENLDDSRKVFYGELKERVKGLSMKDAILEVNHWCHEKVVYRPSDARTSSPLASVKTAYGRCGEESTFTVAALRSVGIPARQVYTPRWAHTDDTHAWVEAWAAGDLETARERQNFSQEVINVICNYRGNIVGGKRIMKLIGLDLGKNRTPFRNMTDEEEAAMKAELEAINFFERCNKF